MTMISDSAMLGELAAEFPGYEFSTQRTWDGVSHFVMVDKPNEFNEAVLEFLAKHNLLKQ